MFHRSPRFALAAAVCGLAALPAFAQDEMMDAPAPEPVDGVSFFAPWAPSWSSPQIERLSEALIGAWKTTSPVAQRDGEGAADIIYLVHPVPVEGLPDALYAEAYRTDQPESPYRQSVFQFYTYEGKPRLRTFDLALGRVAPAVAGRKPANPYAVFAGMGLAPQAFPDLSADDLIATLDQEVQVTGNGFKGKTPQPFPTDLYGAVLMTSEMTVSGDTLTIADRGYAADGSVAWGASASGEFTFRRSEPHITVTTLDNNLIVMDFLVEDGDPVGDGDKLFVDYAGFLADGFMFDTSRQENRDVFEFAFPPRLIEGWNTGLNDVTVGTHRRLIMPSDLGYGDRGQPRANIPPKAPLYFEIEVRAIQTAEEIAAAAEREAEKAANAEGDDVEAVGDDNQ